MSIRDKEIERLTKYAQGLGTVVKFRTAKKQTDEAEWTTDGSEIAIYVGKRTTKIDIVLSLIHELGHQLEYIHGNDREIDEKLNDALYDDGKRSRKKVLLWEQRGAAWWETVYKETDCKFNINKLYISKEFDVWQYEVYCETGDFPSKKQRKLKYKEIKERYA